MLQGSMQYFLINKILHQLIRNEKIKSKAVENEDEIKKKPQQQHMNCEFCLIFSDSLYRITWMKKKCSITFSLVDSSYFILCFSRPDPYMFGFWKESKWHWWIW